MTLSDVLQAGSMDASEFMQKSPDMTVCDLVNSSITQAAREGRLVQGLGDCVTALSRNPSDMVVCILPVDTSRSNVNLNIQLLLIESICLEYEILIVKLDINVLKSGLSSYNPIPEGVAMKVVPGSVVVSSELDCFLIQSSEGGISCSDKKLLHTFQDMWDGGAQIGSFEEFPG